MAAPEPDPPAPPAWRSFPRGCGGLLEWANGFTLFVNLPEAGGAAGAGRAYPNEFFWLPPASAAGAAGEAGEVGQADALPDVDALPASRGDADLWRRGWRLCTTWWPGRGQTAEHPVIQRLLAAGSSGSPGTLPAAAAAAGAAAEDMLLPGASSSSGGGGGGGDGVPEGAAAQQQQQGQQELEPGEGQQAVLLFCRAGNSPYAFCGRLRLAAAAAGGGSGGGSDSGGGGRWDAGGPIVWELADAPAMLGGEAGDALAQLLFT